MKFKFICFALAVTVTMVTIAKVPAKRPAVPLPPIQELKIGRGENSLTIRHDELQDLTVMRIGRLYEDFPDTLEERLNNDPCDYFAYEVPNDMTLQRSSPLRLTHYFIERKTRKVLGGSGSNVYPNKDAYMNAMTNEIMVAVKRTSQGTAIRSPFKYNEATGLYETKFRWRVKGAEAERELVVGACANTNNQIAVMCCIHSVGDGFGVGFRE